jgi:hypothetical protein
MPIVDLQRQFRELGRLRLGHTVPTKGGKRRPEKLKTWRLTSPRADLLERAAEVYGGTVVGWPEAPDGDEYQIITTTDELDMIVPPGRPIGQWNELWGGGGCVRRCDGQTEQIGAVPCVCKREFPDLSERTDAASKGNACKPTTRLQVILPRLPDIGTWLLVSHSYYAAVELAGTVDLLMRAREAGRLIEARLWIDQRSDKRMGQPTKSFPVPAIRIPETFHELMAGGAPALQIGPPNRPALPPGPTLPEDPSFKPPATNAADEDDGVAGCGWRVQYRDGSIDDCTAGEMHAGEHSWKDRAIQEGGTVLRPDAEAVQV